MIATEIEKTDQQIDTNIKKERQRPRRQRHPKTPSRQRRADNSSPTQPQTLRSFPQAAAAAARNQLGPVTQLAHYSPPSARQLHKAGFVPPTQKHSASKGADHHATFTSPRYRVGLAPGLRAGRSSSPSLSVC